MKRFLFNTKFNYYNSTLTDAFSTLLLAKNVYASAGVDWLITCPSVRSSSATKLVNIILKTYELILMRIETGVSQARAFFLILG